LVKFEKFCHGVIRTRPPGKNLAAAIKLIQKFPIRSSESGTNNHAIAGMFSRQGERKRKRGRWPEDSKIVVELP
jgi:hypothetical protein